MAQNAQAASHFQGKQPETSELILEWDNLSIKAWKDLLLHAPQSNVLLSWHAALATFETKRQRPHFGVLYQDSTPVALAVAHTKKIFGFEKVLLYRSPVWLVTPSDKMVVQAFTALKHAWPVKTLRPWVYFMPELPNTPHFTQMLTDWGFTALKRPTYKSIWYDLTLNKETREKALKKGWLSSLKKSRKNKLRYTVDNTRPGYKLFLRGYRQDKALKKYKGPSVLFLLNLRKHASPEDILLLEAWHEGQLVAGQLFVRHGQCATYLVGWTTPEGRQVAAHHGLLFDAAVPELQKRKISKLDLGGLSQSNKNLNAFKAGLRGTSYELAGEWRL